MKPRHALLLSLAVPSLVAFVSCSDDDTDVPPATLRDASLDVPTADRVIPEAAASDVAPESAVTTDASDAGIDGTTDAADATPDAEADAADAADASKWIYVGIGDCSGSDRSGYSTGSVLPDEVECTDASAGTAAVCWDQTTYTNDLVPGSAVGCTYKSVSVASCTGGTRPGYMYECTP